VWVEAGERDERWVGVLLLIGGEGSGLGEDWAASCSPPHTLNQYPSRAHGGREKGKGRGGGLLWPWFPSLILLFCAPLPLSFLLLFTHFLVPLQPPSLAPGQPQEAAILAHSPARPPRRCLPTPAPGPQLDRGRRVGSTSLSHICRHRHRPPPLRPGPPRSGCCAMSAAIAPAIAPAAINFAFGSGGGGVDLA
jgi:hypothetical protein